MERRSAMNLIGARQKEVRDVRLAAAIGLALVLYVVAVNAAGSIQRFLDPWAQMPIAQVLIHGLGIWLCGLLWIAYRRWRDVTVREQELDDIIFSLNPVVLMVVDADDRIRLCNAAVRNVFGHEPKNVVGRGTEVLYRDARPNGHDEVRQQLECAGFCLERAEGRRSSGDTFPVEVFTCRLNGRRGSVVLVNDIRDRVQAEEELLRAKGQLETNLSRLKELEQLRDSLVHMIVHDMKSPLQSVVGYLQLLQIRGGAMDRGVADTRTFVRKALHEATRLSGLVESTLDVSRLESGAMPLNPRKVEIRGLCDHAIERSATWLGSRPVERVFAADTPRARCDPEIIERVVINLLSNAARFSPENGTIRVEADWDEDQVRVTVRDEGEGIPAADRDRIFEKFGVAKSRKRPGSTGLGLAFCKLAVEAHGGRIGVESEVGVGSTFWFTLPAASVAPQKAAPAPAVA